MTDAAKKKMKSLFNSIATKLEQGLSRWECESQFENINDYAVMFKPSVEKIGATFVKMTKRPFGFHFKMENTLVSIGMKASGEMTMKDV